MSGYYKSLNSIEDISNVSNECFQSLYWLSKTEFVDLYFKLKDMDPTYRIKELLVYLNYLKQYPTFKELTKMTGHSSSTLQKFLKRSVEMICIIFEQEPYKFEDRLKAKPLLLKGKLVYAIVDASIYKIESIPDPEVEKLYFSNKHGFHGIKFEFCVDTEGNIVWANGYYDGAIHDIDISQKSNLVNQKLEPNERVLGGLDYASEDFEHFFLTVTKDISPSEKTDEEIYMDMILKGKRTIIENLFGRQNQGLSILKQRYRGDVEYFSDILKSIFCISGKIKLK
ncbi:hypothetical protein DICPUDRAFT_84728 [Dictyostelium purpureum]|uniref:DDE Tnp4 domain-containing protein n=1 Tax=Dictyostelium purpureum TaxID=5786 RepID=F1A3J8_DICPU|nr:uncharacterized protein DICPUDRAFT_84728 [Dictyostelium purpureum]EGC29235.1 hypothetical protein DICPUDRAFT_84728 [Dictyostelium purpureum]|eukprot:XP_003294239.1 hypothetical protein DICPUDRAFT_84728 [Dictyostelium purpureum]